MRVIDDWKFHRRISHVDLCLSVRRLTSNLMQKFGVQK